ncbi:hypothetical protein [Lentzea sp. CC55]|uniref:hypothetical protein n=1 Tax=Lentzea sp. CC55 TaxID=2884909 RepID=UPI001F2A1E15|nr:hypothetical protein [Lentzea sp. CC55]MCG8927318.1 hypothetical protein [Lentzea sp. CC55]
MISHAGFPTWLAEPPPDFLAEQLIPDSVILDVPDAGPGGWAVDTEQVISREVTGPSEEPGTVNYAVLRVRRLS